MHGICAQNLHFCPPLPSFGYAERPASGAAGSGSAADAVGRRLHALVRLVLIPCGSTAPLLDHLIRLEESLGGMAGRAPWRPSGQIGAQISSAARRGDRPAAPLSRFCRHTWPCADRDPRYGRHRRAAHRRLGKNCGVHAWQTALGGRSDDRASVRAEQHVLLHDKRSHVGAAMPAKASF